MLFLNSHHFLRQYEVSFFEMTTSHPKKGHPRRLEGIKRFNYESYNLWNKVNKVLGVQGLTSSEFAEMLLHQNFNPGLPRQNGSGKGPVPGTTAASHSNMLQKVFSTYRL